MDWFDHLSEYNTIQDMPSASINDVSKQSCGILKRKLNHPKSRRTQKAHRKIFSRGDIPIVKGAHFQFY